ncbi:metallohydrolase (plasmid) [Tistrella mobilis]|uniref:metallohydrolase n=1 Tax=Tistrella mobilis TaxID=171437 RepID=UPI003556E62C
MAAVVTFFPVGNGDMTLIQLESGRTILIDINIRQPDGDVRDVAKDLRSRLRVDSNKRPYVDAMLLSHPDRDHCLGLEDNFHLGSLSQYNDPGFQKIVIREMWSSPMVFRRASKNHTLCSDAKAWNKEARRRVNLFQERKSADCGDRILILGEDEDGKTNTLTEILVKSNGLITKIDGFKDETFKGLLLAPMPKGTEDEENTRSKNQSSVIIQFSLAYGARSEACKFLSGGDAEVAIWERIWKDNKNTIQNIEYDLLQAPHHCSWHSLSWDSWSDKGEAVKVSQDARSALGQARTGAYIVASSKKICDDDGDPPCVRAEREYKEILKNVNGIFVNTATHTDKGGAVPMEFEVAADGIILRRVDKKASVSAAPALVGAQPLWHG